MHVIQIRTLPIKDREAAASSWEWVREVRKAKVSHVDLVMSAAFLFSLERRDSPPLRSLGICTGLGPMRASAAARTANNPAPLDSIIQVAWDISQIAGFGAAGGLA